MRVDWIVPARYAEIASDGTMSILGAGIDTLFIAAGDLPARCEMFLALRVAAADDEWGAEDHVLVTTLVDPSGTRQADKPHRLSATSELPHRQRGMEVGFLLASAQNWVAVEHGLYTFEVSIDGRPQRSIPIAVRI